MKLITFTTLLLSLLLVGNLKAQNIEGIATYKTQRQMDVQLDSTQMDDAMQKQLIAMLKKQFQKEFTLQFTDGESVYKEEEKLDAPSPGMGGGMVQVEIMGNGASDVLYKNTNEQQFVNQVESFSKQFLIQDKINDREWKLEKETKNIGDYTCFKATSTYERSVMRTRTISSSSAEETEAPEEEKETITVTAWYTPQIPVKNGPANYDGLPGLILEIADGELSVLCSKIVLNPKNGVDINRPKGGKKVTQDEFDKIMDKKMKEMEEQFHDSRRNNGDQIEIRIGG